MELNDLQQQIVDDVQSSIGVTIHGWYQWGSCLSFIVMIFNEPETITIHYGGEESTVTAQLLKTIIVDRLNERATQALHIPPKPKNPEKGFRGGNLGLWEEKKRNRKPGIYRTSRNISGTSWR